MTFARSIDPVTPLDLAITRVALENRGDKPREDDDEKAATGTIGRKTLVPYGLYRGFGFFNPHFASKSGLDTNDLSIFWDALQQMWDLDRSASRGLMACRGLYVFSHDDGLGNAPAHVLFDRVQIRRKDGVEAPRQFADYEVSVADEKLDGVTLTKLVG
jgi:CRISPR-associated protein Csd2